MKKHATAALATLVALAIAVPLFAAGSVKIDPKAPAWAKWRGPNDNGSSAETAWNPKGLARAKKLWSANVGAGYSSIAVAGNYWFTAGAKADGAERLQCRDVATGKELWGIDLPRPATPLPGSTFDYPGSRSMPVLDGTKLYYFSMDGVLYCVDAEAGSVLWKVDTATKAAAELPNWSFGCSPVIEGNMVLLNTGTGGLALDRATGKLVWKSAAKSAGYASAVPFTYKGRRLAAFFTGDDLSIVEVATGKRLFGYDWPTDYQVNAADPVIVGDRILITSGYGMGALSLLVTDKGLEPDWNDKTILGHVSSPVYLDGCVYANSGAAGGYGDFLCFDFRTGELKWVESGLGHGALIACGKTLLMATEAGSLIAAKASPVEYAELSRRDDAVGRLVWTAPVLCGGRAFIRSDKGEVACFDLSK